MTPATLDRIDARITHWMAAHGIAWLRVSLGVVFFWFGVLKFFPGLSPAEQLATDTISTLSAGLVGPDVSMVVLAVWESLIGVGLMTGRFLRATLLLLFLQMPGTVTPMVIYPELCFRSIPFALTIEGQYIVKNLVLVAAGLVVGGTVRGGRLHADPDAT